MAKTLSKKMRKVKRLRKRTKRTKKIKGGFSADCNLSNQIIGEEIPTWPIYWYNKKGIPRYIELKELPFHGEPGLELNKTYIWAIPIDEEEGSHIFYALENPGNFEDDNVDNYFWVDENNNIVGTSDFIYHSFVAEGKNVHCAGEFTYDGTTMTITNQSGHYKPPAECLESDTFARMANGEDAGNVFNDYGYANVVAQPIMEEEQ